MLHYFLNVFCKTHWSLKPVLVIYKCGLRKASGLCMNNGFAELLHP